MRSTALAVEYEYEEVTVSSIEVLEAHFGALRADVDELKIDFREFRKEFSSVVARIDQDIKDAVSDLRAEISAMAAKAESDLRQFAAHVEAQFVEMRTKIDKNHETVLAKLDATNARIDKTNEKLVEIDKKVDGIDHKLTAFFWVVGLLITFIGGLITAGKAFHWF